MARGELGGGYTTTHPLPLEFAKVASVYPILYFANYLIWHLDDAEALFFGPIDERLSS